MTRRRSERKRVLILGGGFAGLAAAQCADRAARALLWPTVSSLEALRRQGRISLLAER